MVTEGIATARERGDDVKKRKCRWRRRRAENAGWAKTFGLLSLRKGKVEAPGAQDDEPSCFCSQQVVSAKRCERPRLYVIESIHEHVDDKYSVGHKQGLEMVL